MNVLVEKFENFIPTSGKTHPKTEKPPKNSINNGTWLLYFIPAKNVNLILTQIYVYRPKIEILHIRSHADTILEILAQTNRVIVEVLSYCSI